MSKVWKVVMIIVLILVVIGVILAAAGLLTGASANRMVDALGGRQVLEMFVQAFRQEIQKIIAQ